MLIGDMYLSGLLRWRFDRLSDTVRVDWACELESGIRVGALILRGRTGVFPGPALIHVR